MNDGGAAFPGKKCVVRENEQGSWDELINIEGMSLLDYYAGKALQGLIASQDNERPGNIVGTCNDAFEYADAMIEARRQHRIRKG